MVAMTRNPGHRPIIIPLKQEHTMGTITTYIKLTGTKLRETEKAVHFRVEEVDGTVLEDNVTHWFPLSQISSQTTGTADGRDEIKVAEWICKSKELI